MKMEDLTENTMDWDLNINFSHITENPTNKAKWTFCIINDEKGKIPRLQAKGWMLWDKADDGGYVDKIGDTINKSAAKKEPEEGTTYSSVPVGMAGTDKPCVAYLLYMPNEEYKTKVTDVHNRNAKRQIEGVTVQARAHAAAQGEGSDAIIKPEGNLTQSTTSDVAQGNS